MSDIKAVASYDSTEASSVSSLSTQSSSKKQSFFSRVWTSLSTFWPSFKSFDDENIEDRPCRLKPLLSYSDLSRERSLSTLSSSSSSTKVMKGIKSFFGIQTTALPLDTQLQKMDASLKHLEDREEEVFRFGEQLMQRLESLNVAGVKSSGVFDNVMMAYQQRGISGEFFELLEQVDIKAVNNLVKGNKKREEQLCELKKHLGSKAFKKSIATFRGAGDFEKRERDLKEAFIDLFKSSEAPRVFSSRRAINYTCEYLDGEIKTILEDLKDPNRGASDVLLDDLHNHLSYLRQLREEEFDAIEEKMLALYGDSEIQVADFGRQESLYVLAELLPDFDRDGELVDELLLNGSISGSIGQSQYRVLKDFTDSLSKLGFELRVEGKEINIEQLLEELELDYESLDELFIAFDPAKRVEDKTIAGFFKKGRWPRRSEQKAFIDHYLYMLGQPQLKNYAALRLSAFADFASSLAFSSTSGDCRSLLDDLMSRLKGEKSSGHKEALQQLIEARLAERMFSSLAKENPSFKPITDYYTGLLQGSQKTYRPTDSMLFQSTLLDPNFSSAEAYVDSLEARYNYFKTVEKMLQELEGLSYVNSAFKVFLQREVEKGEEKFFSKDTSRGAELPSSVELDKVFIRRLDLEPYYGRLQKMIVS